MNLNILFNKLRIILVWNVCIFNFINVISSIACHFLLLRGEHFRVLSDEMCFQTWNTYKALPVPVMQGLDSWSADWWGQDLKKEEYKILREISGEVNTTKIR